MSGGDAEAAAEAESEDGWTPTVLRSPSALEAGADVPLAGGGKGAALAMDDEEEAPPKASIARIARPTDMDEHHALFKYKDFDL